MQYELHKHNFSGKTTLNDNHIHQYSGVTSPDPDIIGHVHYIMGKTTFDDGHIHQYTLQTGPGIPADGGHTHYYRAATSVQDNHIHYLYGYTGVYGR